MLFVIFAAIAVVFITVAYQKRGRIIEVLKKIWAARKQYGFSGMVRYVAEMSFWHLYGKRKTKKERRHPPKVIENKIVFEANGQFADNSRALYEYMIEKGYNRHYQMVWLVDNPGRYRKYRQENVRFVKEFYVNHRKTTKAYHELRSAKYVFYTVALNWVGCVQKEQIYVDLWHGCSFKDNLLERKIFFDYCVVPSPFFQGKKAKYFMTEERKVLPVGYPRYDVMRRPCPRAAELKQQLLDKAHCSKLVLWMPTFRHSKSKRLNVETLNASEYNLPIVYNREDLEQLNAMCRENQILLILKKHPFHIIKDLSVSEFENILYIDNDWLTDQDIQLYELLHETDALVTDYSSVGVDFMLMNRPLAFTLDDYTVYKEARGFTVEDPKQYMAGHHIYNMNDFHTFLSSIGQGQDEYREERARIAQILHVPCDCCSEKVLQAIGFPMQGEKREEN